MIVRYYLYIGDANLKLELKKKKLILEKGYKVRNKFEIIQILNKNNRFSMI
jgi:hypothetical protein